MWVTGVPLTNRFCGEQMVDFYHNFQKKYIILVISAGWGSAVDGWCSFAVFTGPVVCYKNELQRCV